MKKFFALVIAAVAVLACPVSFAQTVYYPGQQSFQQPNYPVTPQVFTASAQTGTVLTLPPVNNLLIVGVGNTLTTATFAVQGSLDGVNWIPLNVASMTAAGLVGTPALTQTQTAAIADYIVNCAGFNYLRVVTSGTFTGTSLTLQMNLITHRGLV